MGSSDMIERLNRISRNCKWSNENGLLMKEYLNSLKTYLVKFTGQPIEAYPILSDPFPCFFRRDSSIFFTCSKYSCPQLLEWKNVPILPENFSDFLSTITGLQLPSSPEEKAARHALYHSLKALILQSHRDALGHVLERMQRKDWDVFFFFRTANIRSLFYQTADGNLFVCPQQAAVLLMSYTNPFTTGPAYLQLEPLLPALQNEHTAIKPPLWKQYFGQLNLPQATQAAIPAPSLVFGLHHDQYIAVTPGDGQTFQRKQYAAISCTDSSEEDVRIVCNQKYLPMPQEKPVLTPSICNWIHHLCGDQMEVFQELSMALSALIAEPKSHLLVLCTQHSDALRQTLSQIFADCLALDKPVSLNKLITQSNLDQAFFAQLRGKSLIVLQDTPPKDYNLAKLRQLLRGTTMEIQSDYLPIQKYRNHLSYLCVTSDSKKAHMLEHQLHAQVLDLSPCEQTDPVPDSLTPAECAWFRSSFLLYGLRLLSQKEATSKTQKKQPAVKQKKAAKTTKSPQEAVLKQFLTSCFYYSEGEFVPVRTFLPSYDEFLSTCYPQRTDLTMTERKLGTWMKENIPKKFRSGKVEYKRQHSSRYGSSLYGYKNMAFRLPEALQPVPEAAEPGEPAPEAAVSEDSKAAFNQLLNEISETCWIDV